MIRRIRAWVLARRPISEADLLFASAILDHQMRTTRLRDTDGDRLWTLLDD